MLKLGELVAYLKSDDTQFRKGLDKSKDDFKRFGSHLSAAGPALGAAAGVAVAAGLTGALQLDSAKAKLSAQLGDPALADKAGRVAGNVYSKGFGESAEAVGETLRGVLTSGLVDRNATEADIEAITIKAQALADTFGQDVTGTARAAGQMVRTGLAKNAGEALDIITKGFQATGDHAGDMLDTWSEYGTQFRKLGLSGADAMGLMSQGLKGGARDADTVADAIKEFSIRSIDGSKSTKDAFKALGMDAKGMMSDLAAGGDTAKDAFAATLDELMAIKDPVERNAIGVALFGTKWEDMGKAVESLDVDSAAASLGKVGGAADAMGQTLQQSASQKLEAFKRQAQAALVEKMAAAVPYIQQVATWLQANSAYIGPIVTGLGILAVVIGTIIGVYKVWTAVQTALNIVQMASPTTWIILGIVALIAVIVLIATKTRVFQDAWAWAWGGIKRAALAVARWFSGPFAGFFVNAYNKIKGWGNSALDWFKAMPGRLKSALSKLAGFLTAPFRAAFNGIAGLWNRTVGNLSFSVPSWVPGIGGNGFSLPKIPMLAKGGIVPAVAGGRLIVAGEGGEDEAVAPLSKLAGLVGGARSVIQLRSSGSRLDDMLIEILRRAMKGKNIQVELAGR